MCGDGIFYFRTQEDSEEPGGRTWAHRLLLFSPELLFYSLGEENKPGLFIRTSLPGSGSGEDLSYGRCVCVYVCVCVQMCVHVCLGACVYVCVHVLMCVHV